MPGGRGLTGVLAVVSAWEYHAAGGDRVQKFRLREGLRIGDLAAENDQLLESVFVDQGHLGSLLDTSDPRFLILGRTGAGKTALMRLLKSRAEHYSVLNPEELSMQHIHGSPVLRELISWGVSLDIFYKFLWRHVCLLEIIRMRYGDAQEVPPLVERAIALVSTSRRDEQRAKETAQAYLRQYGEQFWVTSDTRIKKIVDEVELKVRKDEVLGARIGLAPVAAGVSLGARGATRVAQTVESETVDRAQNIVSDYLIADLRRVVDLLGRSGFNDPQKRYYLLIDDLDRNWMPDDALYLDLIKSLLYVVNDINRGSPLQGVKIIVALRENIYHRVFQKAMPHEPQREKWLDVQIRLRWGKGGLVELVDRRLAALYRGRYTQDSPRFREMLPAPKKRWGEDPVDYILDRTFMRPRDVIDFVNTTISVAGSVGRLTWTHMTRAEEEYSKRRRQSAFDEWKDSFFGLPLLFPLLTRLGPTFTLDRIGDEDVNRILGDQRCEQCPWLYALVKLFCDDRMSAEDVKVEILKAMYLVGLVGVKQPHSNQVHFSFDQTLDTSPEILGGTTFYVHKMFWSALGLSGPEGNPAK